MMDGRDERNRSRVWEEVGLGEFGEFPGSLRVFFAVVRRALKNGTSLMVSENLSCL